jgi:hypothetical protein
MTFNCDKCLAKVNWKCPPGEFKQCSRRPLAGSNLCGIHVRNIPHGLVADPLAELADAPQEASIAEVASMDEVVGEVFENEEGEWGDSMLGFQNEMAELEHHLGDEALSDIASDDEADSSPSKKAKPSPEEPPTTLAKVLGTVPMASFDFASINQYFHIAKADVPKQHNEQLKHFSDFCLQIPKDGLPAACRVLVDTDVGPISLSGELVKAYLAQLRFQGRSVSSQVLPSGHVTQIVSALKLLQEGVKECGLDVEDIPPWVAKPSKSMTQLIRDWKVVDMANEKPVVRKLFVTGDTIEGYCIQVIIKHMEQKATAIELCESLLLRIQSGRSHRHVNVPGQLKFKDIGQTSASSHGVPTCFFNAMCTKPLGSMTIQGIAHASGKVQMLVTDAITTYLWKAWVDGEWTSAVPQNEAFVFPKQGRNDFSWDHPMPRDQHNRAVQHCAAAMELDLTQEELRQLTSQAVRSGVSVGVARSVRKELDGTNKALGRSSGSNMDIGVYTPKEVLMEPGPVFGDVEGIARRLEAAVSAHFGEVKTELLCVACGYPKCICEMCKNKRGKHTCWLAGRVGPKPKAGYKEIDEQSMARHAAWQKFGIFDLPTWAANAYGWTE